jgi:DNA anti-recombination protein RmuC
VAGPAQAGEQDASGNRHNFRTGARSGITGLLFASRLQTLRERAKADLAGDRASLIERLRHKDQQIDELRAGQRDLQAQLDYSRHELRDEAARRATAEAQAMGQGCDWGS